MASRNKFSPPEPKSPADKKSIAHAVIAKGPDKDGGIDPRTPAKQGRLRHIHIEPAKNGYTVRSSHETSASSDGKSVPFDGGEQQHVFNDHHSMLKHITKSLGCDGEDEEMA